MLASTSNHPVVIVITIGLAMAASPFGVLAIVVMLGTSKPLANGWAFLAGWSVSIAAFGLFTAWLIQQGSANASGSSSSSGVVQLVLGAVVLVGAAVVWRRRGDPRRSGTPKWMTKVEGASPVIAFGLGLFLPTWGLIAPAVDQILNAGLPTQAAVGAFIAFVVTASLGILIPLLIFTLRRQWAESMLAAWRAWLVANSNTVIAVVLMILGLLFVGRGVATLA